MDKMFALACIILTSLFGTTTMYLKKGVVTNLITTDIPKQDTLDPIQQMLLDKNNNSTLRKIIESTLEENNLSVALYLKMKKTESLDINTKIAKTLSNLETLDTDLYPDIAEKNHSLAERTKRIEERTRKIEERAREREEHSRGLEASSREMEEMSRKMEKEARKMEEKSREMEEESRKMEIESRKMEEESKIMEKESKNHSAVLDLLIKEGLIKKGKRFELDFSKDGLIIDGKKQSEELLNKCLNVVSKDFTRMSMDGSYSNDLEIKR